MIPDDSKNGYGRNHNCVFNDPFNGDSLNPFERLRFFSGGET